MENDDFYIGYNDQQPNSIMKFVKSKVFIIGAIIIVAALIFGFSQNTSNNGSFELGSLTEIEGVLHETPYPILRMNLADNTTKDVLLLGYGKMGAEKGLEEIANGTAYQNLKLKVKGTLIYYDGKTLFQLEPNLKEKYEVLGTAKKEQQLSKTALGSISLTGEVIDPKCYFGVMKPGRGKIHRSCGIRCISGGIPPVFITFNENGESNYFLITDKDGKPANQMVLDYVGKTSVLKGELVQVGDWMQIKMADIQTLNESSKIY